MQIPSAAFRLGVRVMALACLGSAVLVPAASAQPVRRRARLALVDPASVANARRPRRPPRRYVPMPRAARPPLVLDDEGWRSVNDGVSEVFFRFFGNIVPSRSGVERPSVDEHMLDAVVAPVAGTPLSLVILGAGNRHLLSSLYFYEQYDGSAALRVGLVPVSAHSPFQLSLTASPLHGSLSQVTRHMGVLELEPDPMPSVVLLGGAAGIDATYTSDVVALEARAYAMPEMDMGHAHATGVSQLESAQIILRLSRMFHGPPENLFDLYFVAMHVDRGDALGAVYDWSVQGFRSARELREVWQAMVVLTLRRD